MINFTISITESLDSVSNSSYDYLDLVNLWPTHDEATTMSQSKPKPKTIDWGEDYDDLDSSTTDSSDILYVVIGTLMGILATMAYYSFA